MSLDATRHAIERGRILQALQTAYGEAPVMVRVLQGALDALGYAMSGEGIQFALQYLAECGYVVVTRARETAAWRPDRVSDVKPDAIVMVKLSVKGLHLVDGLIPADPGVMF